MSSARSREVSVVDSDSLLRPDRDAMVNELNSWLEIWRRQREHV